MEQSDETKGKRAGGQVDKKRTRNRTPNIEARSSANCLTDNMANWCCMQAIWLFEVQCVTRRATSDRRQATAECQQQTVVSVGYSLWSLLTEHKNYFSILVIITFSEVSIICCTLWWHRRIPHTWKYLKNFQKLDNKQQRDNSTLDLITCSKIDFPLNFFGRFSVGIHMPT